MGTLRLRRGLWGSLRETLAARLIWLLPAVGWPAVASAQEPPAPPASTLSVPGSGLERIIELRNGQTRRGRLVAEVPGQYVSIQVKEGGFLRYEWSEVAAVLPDKPPVVATPTLDPQAVEVAIEGAPWVKLAGRLSDSDEKGWHPVCQLPCQRTLSRNFVYQVTGPGMLAEQFTLPSAGTMLRVKVRAGSNIALGVGIPLVVSGGAGVLAGAGLLIADLIKSICLFSSCPQSDLWKTGTPIIVAGGFVTLIGGIVLSRSPTHVDVTIPGQEHAALRIPLSNGVWLTASGLAF